MSWNDAMRRMLTPIGGFEPQTTSPFGAIREKPTTSPHAGVDANYNVGQHGINLTYPALRSPVDGVVTNAGEGRQSDTPNDWYADGADVPVCHKAGECNCPS